MATQLAARHPDTLFVVAGEGPLADILKRAAYAKAGAPSYWLVDTEVPSVTVLDLEGDADTETASAAGDAPLKSPAPSRSRSSRETCFRA